MADNYLEKRYEEVFAKGAGAAKGPQRPGLDNLLRRNRSYRGYDASYHVHPLQMKAILSVNTLTASGMNAQRLRFHAVTEAEEAVIVLQHIKLGAALPELHLPFPGTEPGAFVIVCATTPEDPILDIDLGISLQSMLLKAVEIGLGGIIVRNYDPQKLQAALGLPLAPVAVLAIGRPAETVRLVEVSAGDSLKYYRTDGTHCVPKIKIDDLMISTAY